MKSELILVPPVVEKDQAQIQAGSQRLVKPTIAQLREMIGASENQVREKSSFSLYPNGFSEGSIVEITGYGKTQWLASFLKEHPEDKVAWVESEMSINPYALFQQEVQLKNILFIEAKDQMMWCLTQALESGCFKIFVTGDHQFSENEMRRCQLLAERHRAHFFILAQEFHQTWVPILKLQVLKLDHGFKVFTLKKRGHG
jgi:hypothetical protein